MFNSGQLPTSTPVWRDGMAQWLPASQCGLAPPIGHHTSVQGGPINVGGAMEGDNTGGLIPYKNPKALTSYYMGVGSLVPCLGLFLGPAALFLGLQGLKYNKDYPVVKGVAHAWVGIVLGGLSTFVNWSVVLLMIIGMLSS
jgi:hypothetical protein